MNQGIYPDWSSTQPGTVQTPVQWISGATGAVPALAAFVFSAGILSVVRDGTGLFTIKFRGGACRNLIVMNHCIAQASYSASGAVFAVIKANSVTTVGTFSLQIQTCTAAGAAVDPTTGDRVCLNFLMQWSNPR